MWCAFTAQAILKNRQYIVSEKSLRQSPPCQAGQWLWTVSFQRNRSNKSNRTYLTYTFTNSSISFTARNPDHNAPCIHEDHGERCSPAKCIRPSAADADK